MSATRPALIAAALLAALAIALPAAGCGAGSGGMDSGSEPPDYSEALAAAPPRLAALYENGNEILDGGLDAFERQLERLRGFPVVVNKWASWCGPCRAEFPHLQAQAAEHLDEVAFIGVDSDDSRDAAETFLRDHPVPYPSFFDPDLDIARSIDAEREFPATIFFDREGEIVNVRRGVYATEEELAADIRRYAEE
jgi:cytochrome c biogenesis protein CcmG, thiol:disulfide interchange protein DsbE